MKKWMTYLISMIGVFIFLTILNMGIFGGIAVFTDNDKYMNSMAAYSHGIVKQDSGYVAGTDIIEKMDKLNAFSFLIGDDGKIIWSYNKPDDIPDKYTIKDVAAFSRWYLEDYPVYSWIRDDGLLVVGYKKGSVWKYNFEMGQKTMSTEITFFPYILLANLLVLILLPAWITRKWALDKEKKRSEWIAGISHDIRTPLSVVLGNAERGSVTEKQCLRIKELVNNLNTENKLETGTGSWNRQQIKLARLIRDIVIDHINVSEDKYTFELDIDSSLEDFSIRADESLIRRMFENILSNSVRHNPEGCAVSITMKPVNKKKVRIVVTDNGRGTDEDTLKNLNKKIRPDYLPEHGLGLRVTRQIAGKYKYRLQYKSEAGSFFETELVI